MKLEELKVDDVFVVKNDPKGTRYTVLAHWGGSTAVVPTDAVTNVRSFVDRWGESRSFEYNVAKKTTFAPSTSVVPVGRAI